MPRLAALVSEVVSHEAERRPRLLVGMMASVPARPEPHEEAPEEKGLVGAFIGAAR
jgi:hypothetical protein